MGCQQSADFLKSEIKKTQEQGEVWRQELLESKAEIRKLKLESQKADAKIRALQFKIEKLEMPSNGQ